MSFSAKLADLDRRLTETLIDLPHLASALEFTTICALSDKSVIKTQQYPGLYKIDIQVAGSWRTAQEWLDWFISEWDPPELAKKATPTTKQKRIKKHTVLDEWMPIYIGKAHNVAARVIEHLQLGLEKPTFAMKLESRGTFFTSNTFRLQTLRAEVKNYDLLMPKLEQAARNRFNPIVGRQ